MEREMERDRKMERDREGDKEDNLVRYCVGFVQNKNNEFLVAGINHK